MQSVSTNRGASPSAPAITLAGQNQFRAIRRVVAVTTNEDRRR